MSDELAIQSNVLAALQDQLDELMKLKGLVDRLAGTVDASSAAIDAAAIVVDRNSAVVRAAEELTNDVKRLNLDSAIEVLGQSSDLLKNLSSTQSENFQALQTHLSDHGRHLLGLIDSVKGSSESTETLIKEVSSSLVQEIGRVSNSFRDLSDKIKDKSDLIRTDLSNLQSSNQILSELVSGKAEQLNALIEEEAKKSRNTMAGWILGSVLILIVAMVLVAKFVN
ncbi:MAG: hypothetical protein O3B41_09225 [Bacteroidetes bacterium]|nr:hypothetical protein [Bacteroidota bacterium]